MADPLGRVQQWLPCVGALAGWPLAAFYFSPTHRAKSPHDIASFISPGGIAQIFDRWKFEPGALESRCRLSRFEPLACLRRQHLDQICDPRIFLFPSRRGP